MSALFYIITTSFVVGSARGAPLSSISSDLGVMGLGALHGDHTTTRQPELPLITPEQVDMGSLMIPVFAIALFSLCVVAGTLYWEVRARARRGKDAVAEEGTFIETIFDCSVGEKDVSSLTFEREENYPEIGYDSFAAGIFVSSIPKGRHGIEFFIPIDSAEQTDCSSELDETTCYPISTLSSLQTFDTNEDTYQCMPSCSIIDADVSALYSESETSAFGVDLHLLVDRDAEETSHPEFSLSIWCCTPIEASGGGFPSMIPGRSTPVKDERRPWIELHASQDPVDGVPEENGESDSPDSSHVLFSDLDSESEEEDEVPPPRTPSPRPRPQHQPRLMPAEISVSGVLDVPLTDPFEVDPSARKLTPTEFKRRLANVDIGDVTWSWAGPSYTL